LIACTSQRTTVIQCKNSNQEFASTNGENILKYFLVRRRVVCLLEDFSSFTVQLKAGA